MLLNVFDYRPIINEAGQWAQLGFFFLLVAFRFGTWTQKCDLSRGHYYLGQLVLLVLCLGLLLMAFGPQRITLFRVMVYSVMGLYEAYDFWFGYHFPIPVEHLRANRSPVIPSKPIYVPRQALLRYLADEPEQLAFWHTRTFRYVLMTGVFVFLGAFGFSRWVVGYQQGAERSDKAVKQIEQATKQAVDNAVEMATAEFKQTVDSIARAQSVQLQQASRKGQASRDSLMRKFESMAKSVLQRRRPAPPSRVRITTPAPIERPTQLKTSQNDTSPRDTPADSLLYARQ